MWVRLAATWGLCSWPPSSRLSPAPQQLESVCWERSGHTVVSSHSDGSYAIWAADTGDSPTVQPTVATTPYGECGGPV